MFKLNHYYVQLTFLKPFLKLIFVLYKDALFHLKNDSNSTDHIYHRCTVTTLTGSTDNDCLVIFSGQTLGQVLMEWRIQAYQLLPLLHHLRAQVWAWNIKLGITDCELAVVLDCVSAGEE